MRPRCCLLCPGHRRSGLSDARLCTSMGFSILPESFLGHSKSTGRPGVGGPGLGVFEFSTWVHLRSIALIQRIAATPNIAPVLGRYAGNGPSNSCSTLMCTIAMLTEHSKRHNSLESDALRRLPCTDDRKERRGASLGQFRCWTYLVDRELSSHGRQ